MVCGAQPGSRLGGGRAAAARLTVVALAVLGAALAYVVEGVFPPARALTLAGTASANAAKKKIEADSGALKLLKADLLSNNAQVLQYLWTQTLRDDTHSKLLIGLDSNPAIVST